MGHCKSSPQDKQNAFTRKHEINMKKMELKHKELFEAGDKQSAQRALEFRKEMQMSRQKHEKDMKELESQQQLQKQHENEMNKLKSYMERQIDAKNKLSKQEKENIKKVYENEIKEITKRQNGHTLKLEQEQIKLQQNAEKEKKEFMRCIESMKEVQLKQQITANTKTLNVMTTQRDNISKKLNAIENRASELQAIVSEERARVKKFDVVSLDKNCKAIVILGSTGNGKTTSLKNLFDIELIEDEDDAKQNQARTSTNRITPYKAPNDNIYMIDTPGVKGHFDGVGGDEINATNLVQFLKGCGGINAFVIVLNGQSPRFDAKLQDLFQCLVDWLGKDMFEHTFVLATRIEGAEEFKWKQLSNDIKQRIKTCFNNSIDWPCIPISNAKLQGSQYTPLYAKNEILKLLSGKFKNKFKPKRLTAQILVKRLDEILNKKYKVEKEFLKLETEIFAIQGNINECQKRISNKNTNNNQNVKKSKSKLLAKRKMNDSPNTNNTDAPPSKKVKLGKFKMIDIVNESDRICLIRAACQKSNVTQMTYDKAYQQATKAANASKEYSGSVGDSQKGSFNITVSWQKAYSAFITEGYVQVKPGTTQSFAVVRDNSCYISVAVIKGEPLYISNWSTIDDEFVFKNGHLNSVEEQKEQPPKGILDHLPNTKDIESFNNNSNLKKKIKLSLNEAFNKNDSKLKLKKDGIKFIDGNSKEINIKLIFDGDYDATFKNKSDKQKYVKEIKQQICKELNINEKDILRVKGPFSSSIWVLVVMNIYAFGLGVALGKLITNPNTTPNTTIYNKYKYIIGSGNTNNKEGRQNVNENTHIAITNIIGSNNNPTTQKSNTNYINDNNASNIESDSFDTCDM